jgi:hypothetical protein
MTRLGRRDYDLIENLLILFGFRSAAKQRWTERKFMRKR